MKSNKSLVGILVAVAAIAGTTLAAPAQASNANWDANRAAVMMYEQNMATQAQLNAQACANAQAQAYYQQQLAAQNALAAQQAALVNPYAYYAQPVAVPVAVRGHFHRHWR